MIGIKYYFFADQESQKFYPELPSKVWSFVDGSYEGPLYPNGRCFTAKPTPNMISYGIKKIKLYTTKYTTTVYFHNPQTFATNVVKTSIQLIKHRKLEVDLDHEVFDMLDFGGEPCIDDATYNKDHCVQNEVDKRAIENYGCTTPFGLNKTLICKDIVNGSKVLNIHTDAFVKNKHNCKNPCKLVIIQRTK